MREMIMDRPAPTEAPRKYRVADVPWLEQLPELRDRQFELIHGEVVVMDPAGLWHGGRGARITRFLDIYAEETGLGVATTDTGYYVDSDEWTLLVPDVGFVRMERLDDPDSQKMVADFPDLAVEIKSPNDTYAAMERKAELYLQRGTQLVWLVYPDRRGVDVCRLDEDGEMQRAFINEHGALSGEDVLPGFTLELSRLFS